MLLCSFILPFLEVLIISHSWIGMMRIAYLLYVILYVHSLCKYLMVASGRASVFILRTRVQKTIKVVHTLLLSNSWQSVNQNLQQYDFILQFIMT